MARFEFVDERLLHRGHAISLFESRFRAPDGHEFTREVVRHPGAVSVVPLFADGTVVLVRQYRAPLDRLMLEIPAGKRDVADEPLEVTARRELIEEVGYDSATLTPLLMFHNSVGFCDEESHIFLATDLVEAELDRQGVEEEHMELVRMPLADTPALIRSGEISDAKTVLGLLAALGALES